MIRVKIAGHCFRFNNRYPVTEKRCKNYLTDEEPEVVFEVSDEEMGEFTNVREQGEKEHVAFHGKVVHHLLVQDYLLVHGSCLALDGKGILFTAPSGTGKSTHARLWRERYGDRVTMVNDDKPLVRRDPETGEWWVYGTPWCGKENINNNVCVPLKSIVIIKQGPKNSIRKVDEYNAFVALLTQCFIPQEPELRSRAISRLGEFCKLPVYELTCTISQEAVELSSQLI